MGRPIDHSAVDAYAAAFGKEKKLRSVGFSFLCDITGRLFKSGRVALKDINGNTEVGKLCLRKGFGGLRAKNHSVRGTCVFEQRPGPGLEGRVHCIQRGGFLQCHNLPKGDFATLCPMQTPTQRDASSNGLHTKMVAQDGISSSQNGALHRIRDLVN